MNETTAPRKTLREIQQDAVNAEARERADERSRVEEIVIGKISNRHRGSGRLGEIVRLGADYLAEVIHGDEITWTTVIGGKSGMWHHPTQEHAILHLIAQRYDANSNSNVSAAFYAGRVLGLPESGE
jgi:hypothetical protein